MRGLQRLASLVALVVISPPVHAQSKVDKVPQPVPDAKLPNSPVPSDELRDQPAQYHAQPELVSPPVEPTTRLITVDPTSDTLLNHTVLRAFAAYSVGFGQAAPLATFNDQISPGAVLSLYGGRGFSRYVEAGIQVNFGQYGSADLCPSCRLRAYDVVAGIRYHLVQGVRFDPWVFAGIGYSRSTFRENQNDASSNGIRLADLLVGGDWYATGALGFGPIVGLALSKFFENSGNSPSFNARVSIGLGITFDTPGK